MRIISTLFTIIRYLFITFLFILGISFACLNAEQVQVNYYFGERILSFPLLLACALLVGALLGFLVCLPLLIQTKAQNRLLRRRVNFAEEELANLRAIPILKQD